MSGADSDYVAPAVEFEKATGLKNISTQWVMPGGKTYPEAQEGLVRDALLIKGQRRSLFDIRRPAVSRVLTFYKELMKLNPALNELNTPNMAINTKIDIAMGAISQFNKNDIGYFTSTTKQQRDADTQRTRMENTVALRSNASIQWMPAKETITDIAIQLNQSPAYANICVPQEDARLTQFKHGSDQAEKGTASQCRYTRAKSLCPT